MKILYFGNPLSIHDVKWMSYFSPRHECALVLRADHARSASPQQLAEFSHSHSIPILAELEDFSLARLWRTWQQCQKLSRLIGEFQPDVIHILFAEPNALWSLCRSGKQRTRWILTTRGTDVLVTIPRFYRRRDLLGRIVHWLYCKALQRYDWVAGTSKAQLAVVREQLDFRGHCAVVRTGVDIDWVRQARPHLLPEELRRRPFFFFPRLMSPLYDQELSMEVIAALPDELRRNYVMVFVDCDQGDPAYVAGIRARMGRMPDVQFHFLERQAPLAIWELYKAAELTVMTPRSDGTPVSAMESLICGTPVVAPPLLYDAELAQELLVARSWLPEDFVDQIKRGLGRRVKLEPDSECYRLCDRHFQMNLLENIYLTNPG